MIAQALDLLDHLLPHTFLKGGISRDHGSAEHEILPDHDAQLIADVIEVIRLVVASAPVPDHVHVSIARRLQNLPMLRRRDSSHEAVERNYIRAFGKNRNTVHHKRKAFPPLIRIAAQFKRAQSGAQFGAVLHNGFLSLWEGDRCKELVERLLPISIGIPKTGIGDAERN